MRFSRKRVLMNSGQATEKAENQETGVALFFCCQNSVCPLANHLTMACGLAFH